MSKDRKPVCEWAIDARGAMWREHEQYNSACGGQFVFHIGNPQQNNWQFCPYCGKPLVSRGSPMSSKVPYPRIPELEDA